MNRFPLLLLMLVFNFNFAQKDSISSIKEVKIDGQKKLITQKNGNYKIAVENSVLSSLPNSLDLLSKLPKVKLSSDQESISIIGKGEALIYLDNQKVTIDEVNALSVSDIKNIEIINNPSSKYEAQGKAVVLITRKTNKNEGYKIELSENAVLKHYYSNYLGTNFSFKMKKLELKGSWFYDDQNFFGKSDNRFSIDDFDTQTVNKTIANRTQFRYSLGLYYPFQDGEYLSLMLNATTRYVPWKTKAETYTSKDNTDDFVNTNVENLGKRLWVNSSFNYNKKLNSIKSNLFFASQYSSYSEDLASDLKNNGLNIENRNQNTRVKIFSNKLDFEKKWSSDMKLELGSSYSFSDNSTYFSNQEGVPTTYDYQEKNLSAYSQFSGKLSRFDYSAGLRLENTATKGGFEDWEPLVNSNYTRFFPKTEINFNIDSTKTLSFNYAKSIERPNYNDVNQRNIYVNPYFNYMGNYFLNPEISNDLSLIFDYSGKSLRFTFSQTKHPIYNYIILNDNASFTEKPFNFNKESGFELSFDYPFKYKKWTSSNTLTGSLNKISDPIAIISKSKPSLYYYSNNEFQLPRHYLMVVTFSGQTKRYEGIYERTGYFIIDLAFSKKFFNKLDCSLRFNDIFKGSKEFNAYTVNGIQALEKYYSDVRSVSFAMKYTFGGIKDFKYKNKTADENTSRIQ